MQPVLGLSDALAKFILSAVLLLAVCGGMFYAGYQSAESKWAHRLVEAERAARKQEQTLLAERDKAQRALAAARDRAHRDASGAGAELERLRDQLAAADSGACAAAEPRVDRAYKTTRDILSACSEALISMAAEADRITVIAGGLQDYVRNVCPGPKTP